MVMGGVKTARTSEQIESDRNERNAWLFAGVMVLGCCIPIAAAIALKSPTRAPMIAEATGTPVPHHAQPEHGGH
jgi:hypothetical protein